jgi:hypothetical protein
MAPGFDLAGAVPPIHEEVHYLIALAGRLIATALAVVRRVNFCSGQSIPQS